MADLKAMYTELRQPLLSSGALWLGLLILMVAAGAFSSRMEQARQTSQQQLQASVRDYRATREAGQILQTDAQYFTRLREQGFVGPEPRLRWIEDLRAAAAQAGLVAIRYELEPRRAAPTAVSGATSEGTYTLYVSPMKLVLELRHEGDLPRFLARLEARHGGLFDLTACSLRRPRDGDISLEEANVSADCALRWYSLDAAETVAYGEAQ
ncbi:MAG: hypothetical protein K8I04_14805 [Gammaproteobacteria bacterium]|nr:hypothetical protein [Gammaproteobacteria bacterium]